MIHPSYKKWVRAVKSERAYGGFHLKEVKKEKQISI